MAMKRDGESQPDFIVSLADVPRSLGQAFYDKLQKLLVQAGFHRFVEGAARPVMRRGCGAIGAAW
jgi:transposase